MSEPLILVADDNQEIREFLEEALTTLGDFRVHTVGDGMSALSLVNELGPDLVISDQQMLPKLSSSSRCGHSRAKPRRMPDTWLSDVKECERINCNHQGTYKYCLLCCLFT